MGAAWAAWAMRMRARSHSGYLNRITANFPRMRYELIQTPNTQQERLLLGQGCDGLLAPKIFYDGWRTEARFCNFEIVQTLYPDTAGWVTSKERCVCAVWWGGVHAARPAHCLCGGVHA